MFDSSNSQPVQTTLNTGLLSLGATGSIFCVQSNTVLPDSDSPLLKKLGMSSFESYISSSGDDTESTHWMDGIGFPDLRPSDHENDKKYSEECLNQLLRNKHALTCDLQPCLSQMKEIIAMKEEKLQNLLSQAKQLQSEIEQQQELCDEADTRLSENRRQLLQDEPVHVSEIKLWLKEILPDTVYEANEEKIEGWRVSTKIGIRSLNDALLQSIGIRDDADRRCILKQIGGFNQECSICMSNRRTHAFIPCGHKCICGVCERTQKFDKCPMCRKRVHGVVQIYE